MDNKELEQQRLDLEKQKLEFEQVKLEHEKEKFKQTSFQNVGKIRVGAMIAAIVMIISVFLPWVESSASGFGASFSASASGINSMQGVLVLLLGLTSVVLIILKNKFSYLPAILSILFALSIITGIGSSSMSSFGVSARAGFGIGPIITLAAGILQIFLTIVPFGKSNTGEQSDFKGFVIKNQFWIILPITFCFTFYFISLRTYEDFTFISLIFFLIISLGVYYSYNYLKLNNTKNIYLIGFISNFLINRIIHYFATPEYYKASPAFNTNLKSAGQIFFEYFSIIFLVLFICALIFDLLKKHNVSIISGSIEKWVVRCLNIKIYVFISVLMIFIPFIYYSISRTVITTKDKQNFLEINKQLKGNWYYFNKDSTEIFEFSMSPRQDVYQIDYEDSLCVSTDIWGRNPYNNESFQFNTKIKNQYKEKIKTPINLSNSITIELLSPEKMIFSINNNQNSSLKITAESDLRKVKNKFLEIKQKGSKQIINAQFSHVYSDNSETELIFIDENGNSLRIPFFGNNFGSIEFYNPKTREENIQMRGQMFKLTLVINYFLLENGQYNSRIKLLEITPLEYAVEEFYGDGE